MKTKLLCCCKGGFLNQKYGSMQMIHKPPQQIIIAWIKPLRAVDRHTVD